jgi:Tfp pilus assembly protein PilO
MGDPTDLSALLGVLIDRADSAGVRFVRIQPQGESSAGDYVLYPVVLEFATAFDPLAKLIASLESLPQLVRVDRVAVTAAHEGKLNVSILCTCFLHGAEGRAP